MASSTELDDLFCAALDVESCGLGNRIWGVKLVGIVGMVMSSMSVGVGNMMHLDGSRIGRAEGYGSGIQSALIDDWIVGMMGTVLLLLGLKLLLLLLLVVVLMLMLTRLWLA